MFAMLPPFCAPRTAHLLLGALLALLPNSRAQDGDWTAAPLMPTGRFGASSGVIDGKLYVVGGAIGACLRTDANECFDPGTDRWTTRAPMPTARDNAASAVLDGKLYVIGGEANCGTLYSTVEVYDAVSDSWSTKASLPIATQALAAASLDGKLYVAGGGGLNNLWAYDPGTDSWSGLASMPLGVAGHAMAAVCGRLYVLGGSDNPAQKRVQIYDAASNSWSLGSPLELPQYFTHAATIGGTIYLLGGDTTAGQVTGLVQAYDVHDDSTRVVTAMPTARSDSAVGVIDGAIYVAGGSPGFLAFLQTVERFTPQWSPGGTWIAGAAMPTGRFGAASGVIDGKFYVVGGAIGACLRTDANEVYDPATGAWSAKAPMPTARDNAAGAVLDGKLYVIGGEANCGTLYATVEAYDPVSNSWSTKAPLPVATQALAAASLDGKLYVTGGGGLDSLWAYDPGTNAWSGLAPMPVAASGHGMAALCDRLYVLGGADNPTQQLVQIYDVASDSWSLGSQLPQPQYFTRVATIGDTIYLVGGNTTAGQVTGMVQAYDTQHDVALVVNPMATARSDAAVGTIDGVLYAAGGAPGSLAFLTTLEAQLPSAPWKDLGLGLAGTSGTPKLVGGGTLAAGSSNRLDLSSAKPSSPATLVFGLSTLNAPFKGGTLVPAPTLLVSMATGGTGKASLPFTMPTGLPAGVAFVFQFWIQDAAGPKGFAASNGLRGLTD